MFAARWGQLGVLYSYLGVFLADIDFSLVQVGVLYTVMMVGLMLGSSLVPLAADYWMCHKPLALGAHAVASLTMFGLRFVHAGDLKVAIAIMIVANFFNGGFGAIVDSAVFQICAEFKSSSFGHMRLWGCVGWGFTVLVTSSIMNMTDEPMHVLWVAFLVLAPVTSVTSFILLHHTDFSSKKKSSGVGDKPSSLTVLSYLLAFVTHPLAAAFLVAVFFLGTLFAALNTYVWIWAIDNLEATYLTVGVRHRPTATCSRSRDLTIVVLPVACCLLLMFKTATVMLNVCEVLIFFVSKSVSQRVGVHGVLYISGVAYSMRLVAYAYFVQNGWWLVVKSLRLPYQY